MNLDIIQLPYFVIAELYKDCLVEQEAIPAKQKPAPVTKKDVIKEEPAVISKPLLKFLGQNKKNIVVVVHEQKALIINENELDFLSKILVACTLNLADIAIVNTHNQEVNYTLLKEQFNAQFFLLLGAEPGSIKLPFTIPHFQVQPFAESTFVYTPSLAGMLPNTAESKLLKSKLWLSLKTAFKL